MKFTLKKTIKKRRILIIDDEEDFLFVIKAHLDLTDRYETITALDGKQGLKLAKIRKPHLILLDLIMPKISGLQVLKKLKEDEKTMFIPVIILTAKDDEKTMMKAVELYCENYLLKPIETELLISKIESALSMKYANR